MGGSSSSDQTSEGDLIFNNMNQSAGGGGGPLKNFNVGRSNSLKNNSFNIETTDQGAVKNALQGITSVVNTIGKDTGQTARKAVEAGQSTAEKAIDETSQTARRSIESSEKQARLVADVSDNAQESVLDLAQDSLGTFSQLFTNTQAQSERATEKALDTVFAASQSESQQNTNELIKFGIGGGVVIGTLYALSQLAKG